MQQTSNGAVANKCLGSLTSHVVCFSPGCCRHEGFFCTSWLIVAAVDGTRASRAINRHTQAITYHLRCSTVLVEASPRSFIRVKSVRHVSGLSGPGPGTRQQAVLCARPAQEHLRVSTFHAVITRERERAKRARIRAKPESLHPPRRRTNLSQGNLGTCKRGAARTIPSRGASSSACFLGDKETLHVHARWSLCTYH